MFYSKKPIVFTEYVDKITLSASNDKKDNQSIQQRHMYMEQIKK